MSDPPIQVEAGIVLQPLDDAQINRVVNGFRDRVDDMLRGIEALRTEVNLRADVDTQPVEDAQRLIDSLDAEAVLIPIDVDDAELSTAQRLADSLDADVVVIPVDVEDSELLAADRLVDNLDAETVLIPVDVEDSEIGAAQRQVDNLDAETVSVPVDVEDAELKDTLKQIQTVQILHVAIDVLQGAEGIPIVGNLVGAVSDSETALRTFETTTGEAVGNAADIIDTLYTEAWAGSRTEIARVIALASNLGVGQSELEGTARSALAAATAIEGITGEAQNANDILRAQQQLVNLGLARDFEHASDIIVAGFQSTIGASGDFLGDLGEFAPTFAELDFTADQMLTTLETGLSGGVDNISRMSEGLISFNELASGMDEGFVQALQTIDDATGTNLLDQLDLFNAGQLGGAEFMGSVLEAVRNYQPSGNLPTVQGILGSLFGGTATNIGAQALLNIDPIAGQFTEIEGLATASSDRIRDTFNGAVTEIGRFIEQEAVTWFNEGDLNLDQKMEDLKAAFRTTIDEIKAGADLGDAIEVGFEIEGFSENLDRLESIFGNFILLLGDVSIAFANLTGNTQLADSIRLALAPIAEGQLAFDLQLANPEQVAGAVDAALSRGVDAADVGGAIQTAIDELRAEGDFGQIFNITEGLLDAGGFSPEFQAQIQGIADRVAGDTHEALRTALAAGDFDMVASIVDSLQGTELQSGVEGVLIDAFRTAIDSGNLIDAGAIAQQLNDPTISAEFERTFNEYSAIAAAAFENGGFREALDIANQIGDIDLAREAFERLRNTVFQPTGGAGAASAGGMGPSTSGNLPTGTIFDQAIAAASAMEQAFTEKEPLIDAKLGKLSSSFALLNEESAVNMTTISENFALMAGQIDADISRVDPRLQGVQDDIGGIQSKSEEVLPLVIEAFTGFADGFLETTDPIMERLAAIVTGIDDVNESVGTLPGASASGDVGASAESRDFGGAVQAGQAYMVNGELFISPFDAVALGLDNSSNLMSLFSGGAGGGTTNYYNSSTNVNVQQQLHAASQAEAASAGDRFADALRGF